jgi:hypothetical protein
MKDQGIIFTRNVKKYVNTAMIIKKMYPEQIKLPYKAKNFEIVFEYTPLEYEILKQTYNKIAFHRHVILIVRAAE